MPRAARPAVNGRITTRRVSHAKTAEVEPDEEVDGGADAGSGDDVPAAPPPGDALSEMMATLHGTNDSRITVYRIVRNQPPSYVFECTPTTFSLDELRDKYNGGEFRLYIMKEGRLWKNMRVVVEPKSHYGTSEPAAPNNTHMAEVMSLVREGFATQATALREALAGRNNPSPFASMDLPAVITAIAAAVTALRPPPAPAPPDTSSTMMDVFMRGIEIANSMRGDGPADSSIGGMLREALRSPIVAAAVQNAMTPHQPTPPARPAIAGPQPQIPQQVSHAKPAEVPQPTVDQEVQVLAHYLGFLVTKAQAGADPTLYADIVLDNVPDKQMTDLLNKGPGLIDFLIETRPEVAQHRDWFVALIQSVNDALTPEEPAQPGVIHAADPASIVVPGNVAQ